MKVYYDSGRDLIFVEGTGTVWPARSLLAATDGTSISILLPDGATRVLGPLQPSQIEQRDADAAPFPGVASAMAYLATVFSTSRSDVALTAVAPIFGGRAVMYAGATGTAIHADPTTDGYIFAGIATQSAAAGLAVTVRRRDLVSFSGWAWVPGRAVFALPGGVLTQSAPDNGVLHQVGNAIEATTILIDPSELIYL